MKNFSRLIRTLSAVVVLTIAAVTVASAGHDKGSGRSLEGHDQRPGLFLQGHDQGTGRS